MPVSRVNSCDSCSAAGSSSGCDHSGSRTVTVTGWRGDERQPASAKMSRDEMNTTPALKDRRDRQCLPACNSQLDDFEILNLIIFPISVDAGRHRRGYIANT